MGESDRKTALEMEVYREGEEDPRQDKKIVRQLGSYRERTRLRWHKDREGSEY